jgi:hypothetical protein
MRWSLLASLFLPTCIAFSSIYNGGKSEGNASCKVRRQCSNLFHKDSPRQVAPFIGRQPRVSTNLCCNTNKSIMKVAGAFHCIMDRIFSFLAYPLALLLTKVLQHSSVQDALGKCIVSGVKQLCIDPDLDQYFDKAAEILNKDLEKDAREAGEEFPLIVQNFLTGIVFSKWRKSDNVSI